MTKNVFDPTPLVVFDLEATCWDDNDPMRERQREESEIIEIGAAMMRFNPETETYYPAEEFSTFIRPRIHPLLTDFCTKLTSIKQEDVDNAPYLDEAVKLFTNWMVEMDRVPVHPEVMRDRYPFFRMGSWGRYDHRMLQDSMDRENIFSSVILGSNPINLKECYTDQMKLLRRPIHGGRGLAAALRANKLDVTGSLHRGVDDARNTARLMATLWRRENITGHQIERRTMNLLTVSDKD
jgi:hypothetical protein